MKRYFFFKLFSMVFSLLAVITITFVVLKSLPGNPLLKDINVSEEALSNLYKQYGFDKPLHVQYWDYLKRIFHLDFGVSFIFQGRSVLKIIKEGFPFSFSLGMQSVLIALITGIFFGTLSAFRSTKWQENIFIVIFSIGVSTPHFLIAILFQYVFSMKLLLIPPAKLQSFVHLLIPSISLAILPACFIAKLIKDNINELLQSDHIKLAMVKGLSHKKIIRNHLLKNSLLPLMGYLPSLCINIVLGSFIVEKIFGIPGIGYGLVTSILCRDYPLTLGLTLFFSSFLILVIFTFDLLHPLVDPRIRLKTHD